MREIEVISMSPSKGTFLHFSEGPGAPTAAHTLLSSSSERDNGMGGAMATEPSKKSLLIYLPLLPYDPR